jgi:class 3 adenylate cyclase/pSer/pThr/pTyr-binding forkhead associated (FHA) protein
MPMSESVTRIIAASRSNPELLAQLERFRRDIAVMFTDIKGSTSYFEKYGDIAGLMMVSECNDRLKQTVEAFGGRFVKTIGDAIMATFDDCVAAINSAIAMQNAMGELNKSRAADSQISIRVGLNHGSGIVKSNDVFGDVVNVASRVESAAHPEQIVISASVHERIAACGRFKIRALGRYSLRGKGGEFDLYEVLWNETLAQSPAAAHTMVTVMGKAFPIASKFRLRHVRRDGSEGAEFDLKGGKLTVGSGIADVRFASDPLLAPVHAEFLDDHGQLTVRDVSGGAGVFVRLLGTYTLQAGDVIRLGRQLLEFHAKRDALTAAAATGTAILELNRMLDEPVAELVAATPGMRTRYPILDEEVTVGRTKGTFQFPEDALVSGLHARIYQRGEDYFLEDVGSRNGTFVKVHCSMPVPAGTTVQVGGQLLKVTQ